MKHVGTVLFLIACLAAGIFIGNGGSFLFNKRLPAARPERPLGVGPLPDMRGFHNALTLDSPIDKWKEQAAHDAGLGATWITLEAPAGAFEARPEADSALKKIADAVHESRLKFMFIAHIPASMPMTAYMDPPQTPADLLAQPPAINAIQSMLTAANAADIDVLALDGGIGEHEPDDAKWSVFFHSVRDNYRSPICYIASRWGAFRVTWWNEVDYVGVRGPIPLVERPDAAKREETLHYLQMSWCARQDMVMTLSSTPVIFFDVGFNDAQSSRREIEYQAAISTSRGQESWLAGMFMALPGDTSNQGVEKAIQGEWTH